MNLGQREERVLRAIERDLNVSDPRLSRLFLAFTLRTGCAARPRTERVRAWSTPRMMRGRRLTGRHSGPVGRPRFQGTLRVAVAVCALACAMFLTGFGRGVSRVLIR
jgi:hypothetical protein